MSSNPKTTRTTKEVRKVKSITLSSHQSQVRSVNYNRDGKVLVSGGCDGTIRVWDAINGGDPIMSLNATESTDCVYSAEYSPHGTRIVSGADDKSIKMWNALDGSLIYTIQLDNKVRSVGFNNISSRIVSSSGNVVQIWDATLGSSIMNLTGHTEFITAVKYSPDGTLIASGSNDNTIKIWDAINGGSAKLNLVGHTNTVSSVAFSPDGKRLASTSWDGAVKIWNPISGKLIMSLLGHLGEVWSVAFSPDGNNIVSSGSDGTIEIWDAKIAQNPILTIGQIGYVYDIDFSPDGTNIAITSNLYPNYDVEVWDIFSAPTPTPTILSSTPSPIFYPTLPPSEIAQMKETVSAPNLVDGIAARVGFGFVVIAVMLILTTSFIYRKKGRLELENDDIIYEDFQIEGKCIA